MNTKLVIFDMDGLMFDTESIGNVIYPQAAKAFGYDISNELMLSLIGGNKERNRKILMEALGEDYPASEVSKLSQKLRYAYLEEHGLGIKKGLLELLDYLTQKGIKKAVASSSNRDVIDYYLKLANLENVFDYIISGDQITNSKPHPEIFLNACEHFNIDVQEALVLEDSRNGVLAAIAGNIPVICIPDLIYHDRDLFDSTFAFVSSLDKVIDILEGKKIQLAIFDMDGLMFDTESLCEEPLIEAHKRFGIEMTTKHCNDIIGTSGAVCKKILMDAFGDYPYDEVMKEFDSIFLDKIRKEGLPIKEGLYDLLEDLKQKHIPCVIGSSSHTSVIEEYLDLSDTRKYFCHIVAGDHVAHSKPEPDIFIKACKDMNVNPKDALVLEDSRNGIIASGRANVPVICVPDIIYHREDMLKEAFAFVPNLSKIKDIVKGE